jgi:hypothetical protein
MEKPHGMGTELSTRSAPAAHTVSDQPSQRLEFRFPRARFESEQLSRRLTADRRGLP